MSGARLLLVEDDAFQRETTADLLATLPGVGAVKAVAGVQEALALSSENFHVAVLDHGLPDGTPFEIVERFRAADLSTRFIMLTGMATVETAVQALRHRIDDFLEKPLDLDALEQAILASLERHELAQYREVGRVKDATSRRELSLASDEPAYLEALENAKLAADTDRPVLLTGETGTGKTVLARVVHDLSSRRDKPFVAVNCAAIPASLMESELFGAKKGSFTGATSDRKGLVELADGGTLFLDELAELDVTLQSKLLTLLDGRGFRRLGDERERTADIRVVAATNVALERAVESGAFRSDLYYRLNVLRVKLPPLRERPRDIARLVRFTLDRLAPGRDLKLAPGELDRLLVYRWPGNLRELRNVLDRAALLDSSAALRPSRFLTPQEEVPTPVPTPAPGRPTCAPASLAPAASGARDLETVERKHILGVLAQEQGHRARTAEVLGISISTLRRRLRQFGVDAVPAGGRAPTPDPTPDLRGAEVEPFNLHGRSFKMTGTRSG